MTDASNTAAPPPSDTPRGPRVVRCGVTTRAGAPCRQAVDLLPCRYHDRPELYAWVAAINAGRLSLCGPCRRWYAAAGPRHICGAGPHVVEHSTATRGVPYASPRNHVRTMKGGAAR